MKFSFVFVLFCLRGSLACFRVDSYETVYAETGTGFSKECQCEEEGFSLKDLKWLGPDDREVSLSGLGAVITQEVENGLNMDITSMSKTLSGDYKCVTNVDGQRFSQTYNIHVFDPLVFTNSDEDQNLLEETDSLLYCEVVADAPPMFTWYKILNDGSEVQLYDSDKYRLMPQGLLIRNVTTDDSGTFKCRVSVMSTGEDVDRSIAVKVMTVPKILRLSAQPSDYIVKGDRVTLQCIADSTPFPEYSWNKTTGTNQNKSWYEEENTIVFNSIQPEDNGTYECFAQNPAGGVKQEITIDVINVLIPPVILNFTNLTAIENELQQISCNAQGYPIPNVTIMFNGKKNEESEIDAPDVEFLENHETIRVNRTHEGFYICNASNRVDFVTEKMYLTVYHKPYFEQLFETVWGWEGQTVMLNCDFKSNTPAEIKWRYQSNDIPTSTLVEQNKMLIDVLNSEQRSNWQLNINDTTFYGIYECTARNKIGESTKFINLNQKFPPPPVRNASVIEITATTATFTIDGQNDDDKASHITGYTAEYDTEDNYLVTDIHKNRTWAISRPFVLENLKPNTAYRVSFVAVNEVGSGMKSEEFLKFQTLNTSVPDPPEWELDTMELYLNKSQILKWKEPPSNGAPIDYYIIRYCPVNDENMCKEIHTVEPEIELKDLNENTTYYLGVVAHNSEGDSLAANTIIQTLPLMFEPPAFMSGGVLIGVSIVVVIICILLLDLVFFFWKQQGIIASCCLRKKKTQETGNAQARDKKGLLKDNGESCDALRPTNGHKEFEYNKNTGVITGKHSAV